MYIYLYQSHHDEERNDVMDQKILNDFHALINRNTPGSLLTVMCDMFDYLSEDHTFPKGSDMPEKYSNMTETSSKYVRDFILIKDSHLMVSNIIMKYKLMSEKSEQ